MLRCDEVLRRSGWWWLKVKDERCVASWFFVPRPASADRILHQPAEEPAIAEPSRASEKSAPLASDHSKGFGNRRSWNRMVKKRESNRLPTTQSALRAIRKERWVAYYFSVVLRPRRRCRSKKGTNEVNPKNACFSRGKLMRERASLARNLSILRKEGALELRKEDSTRRESDKKEAGERLCKGRDEEVKARRVSLEGGE